MQSVTRPKCCRLSARFSARVPSRYGPSRGIKCAWYCHCARWTMAGPDSGQCPCEGQIKRALVEATSAFAGTGHQPPHAQGSNVPILLQKSFPTVIKFLSRLLMRFSDKYVRDLVSQ